MSADRWRPRLTRLVVAGCVAACAMVLSAVGAPTVAAAQSEECAPPGEPYQAVPWSQRLVAAERVWPFSRGAGVTVAVLASGVDAEHPQLAGQVAEGFDALAGSGSADTDCHGLGTQVAGVIAARQLPDSGFAGVAPGVRLLPVRVIDGRQFGDPIADPDVLAKGIRWAAERADVLVVAVAAYAAADDLAAAVEEAADRGVLIVAAVGDLGSDTDGNPRPYPATYDGVVGVGAVDPNVLRWPGSQYGQYVDLVAPGAEVVTLQRGGGMISATGTGVAAGFVGGAAALAMAADPDASPQQIVDRLTATATPAPGGRWSPEYGRGVVNPYAAVHDRLVPASPAAMPAITRPEQEQRPEWIRSREFATMGALGTLALVVGVIAAAAALPRGRRRRWRPAVASPPPGSGEPHEPGPPLQLFDEK